MELIKTKHGEQLAEDVHKLFAIQKVTPRIWIVVHGRTGRKFDSGTHRTRRDAIVAVRNALLYLKQRGSLVKALKEATSSRKFSQVMARWPSARRIPF